MKHIVQKLMIAALLVAGVATAIVAQPALATTGCTGKDCVIEGADKVDTGGSRPLPETITQITDILLFFVGAVSVIMLVIGGFKYVVSNGNAEQVKNAKNTIMYSIVGLVVALIAYAAVRWVVAQL